MQTNVKATIAKCYENSMKQDDTVAYTLIHHCCGELPPFNAKQKVTEYVAEYYELRTRHKI